MSNVFHKIKTDQFEGPLDLLLQLIEDQKLEITQVALAQVTEQYIKILNQNQSQVRIEELADFLVIAARLLLIKSRALLPFLEWEDEEEEDLTRQLKIYKEYLDAMKVIQALLAKKRISFAKLKMAVQQEVEFSPPAKLQADDLRETFFSIIKGLDPLINLPTEMIKKSINIQEKITSIRERLLRESKANFSEILKEAKDKTEVIVTFLALLELIKQRTVVARQGDSFADIEIERLENEKP